MADASIVRNRRKIEAAITNAAAVQRLRALGGLDEVFWSAAPAHHTPPGASPTSRRAPRPPSRSHAPSRATGSSGWGRPRCTPPCRRAASSTTTSAAATGAPDEVPVPRPGARGIPAVPAVLVRAADGRGRAPGAGDVDRTAPGLPLDDGPLGRLVVPRDRRARLSGAAADRSRHRRAGPERLGVLPRVPPAGAAADDGDRPRLSRGRLDPGAGLRGGRGAGHRGAAARPGRPARRVRRGAGLCHASSPRRSCRWPTPSPWRCCCWPGSSSRSRASGGWSPRRSPWRSGSPGRSRCPWAWSPWWRSCCAGATAPGAGWPAARRSRWSPCWRPAAWRGWPGRPSPGGHRGPLGLHRHDGDVARGAVRSRRSGRGWTSPVATLAGDTVRPDGAGGAGRRVVVLMVVGPWATGAGPELRALVPGLPGLPRVVLDPLTSIFRYVLPLFPLGRRCSSAALGWLATRRGGCGRAPGCSSLAASAGRSVDLGAATSSCRRRTTRRDRDRPAGRRDVRAAAPWAAWALAARALPARRYTADPGVSRSSPCGWRRPGSRTPAGVGHLDPGYLDILGSWDSTWYHRVATRAIPSTLPVRPGLRQVTFSAWAFYPVFPMVRGARCVGLPFLVAATVVNLAAGAASMLLVWRLLSARAGDCVPARERHGAAGQHAVVPLSRHRRAADRLLRGPRYGAPRRVPLLLLQRRYRGWPCWCCCSGFTRAVAPPLACVVLAHLVLRWREDRGRQRQPAGAASGSPRS